MLQYEVVIRPGLGLRLGWCWIHVFVSPTLYVYLHFMEYIYVSIEQLSISDWKYLICMYQEIDVDGFY
jgi:hypothetical protein